jgi:hypothetical protein
VTEIASSPLLSLACSPQTNIFKGLTILYGADYFTEAEWINIDRLVHKGQYVFTQGPRNNFLEEPLLMSFDEPADGQIHPTPQIQLFAPIENNKNEKLLVSISEQQILSPSSEQASTGFQTQIPNGASAEISSDEEQLPEKKDVETDSPPMFDFSETAEPVLPEPTQSIQPPQVKPPTGPKFSEEQLAQARALQASMTKAGQKKRPKYEKVKEECPGSEWSQNEGYPADITERPYASPTPADRENNIKSWADNVDIEVATLDSAPAPIRSSQTPKIPSNGNTPQPMSPLKSRRSPRSRRSASRASSMTAKSVGKGKAPQLTPGEVLVAGLGQDAKGIQMNIRPGDKIKYIKPVLFSQLICRLLICCRPYADQ